MVGVGNHERRVEAPPPFGTAGDRIRGLRRPVHCVLSLPSGVPQRRQYADAAAERRCARHSRPRDGDRGAGPRNRHFPDRNARGTAGPRLANGAGRPRSAGLDRRCACVGDRLWARQWLAYRLCGRAVAVRDAGDRPVPCRAWTGVPLPARRRAVEPWNGRLPDGWGRVRSSACRRRS